MWHLLTLVMMFVRGVLFLLILQRVSAGAYMFVPVAIIEGASLWFSVANWRNAVAYDRSLGGPAVVVVYLGGWLLVPSGVAIPLAGWVIYYVGWIVSAVALCHLQDSFTCGPSSFVKLRDRGIYRVVRHPQLAGKLLMIVGLIGLGAGVWWLVALQSAMIVAVILVEDRFLMDQPGYREYAAGRARVLPGVW